MKPNQPIQISIPNPCHEDWDKMTSKEQGRFCSSCQKCVVDFTGFSDEQLYKFLAEREGQKICGRFNSTQLNRKINIPHQPHSTLYKWMIAAGLVLVFTVTSDIKSFAQAPLIETVEIKEDKRGVDSASVKKGLTVKGIVVDEINEPLINAVVELTMNGIFRGGAVTNFDGVFEITPLLPGKYEILVRSIGYGSYRKKLDVKDEYSDLKLQLKPGGAILGLLHYIEYKVPLINKYESGGTRTITSDELERGAY